MSILNSILNHPSPSAPKGIIYGPPGVGKSTFGASIENSLIIDCENGVGAIPCQRTPYLSTWPEIEKWLLAVERDQHNYGAVVIDTIDWLLRRLEEHVCGSNKKLESTLNKSHGGYGNGKQVMRNYVYGTLLPILDRIVGRGIAVILLAHADRKAITDEDGVTREKTAPDLPADHLNTIIEWADFLCLARLDASGNRVLVTAETFQALAKNRYNLPSPLPMHWPSFVQTMSSGLAGLFPAAQ